MLHARRNICCMNTMTSSCKINSILTSSRIYFKYTTIGFQKSLNMFTYSFPLVLNNSIKTISHVKNCGLLVEGGSSQMLIRVFYHVPEFSIAINFCFAKKDEIGRAHV